MSVNLKPRAPINLKSWLDYSTDLLDRVGIASANLDSYILLSNVLKKPKPWIIANEDYVIGDTEIDLLDKLLMRRKQREPIAYLVGSKEFYGRTFEVNNHVLIPRPETEKLIEIALPRIKDNSVILDIGTGSGCIGITLALEAKASVIMSDISVESLEIAEKNARLLNSNNVQFALSDLLSQWLGGDVKRQFDMIVANLPYVDESWMSSPETKYEPSNALYADDGGLALIKLLIDQSDEVLSRNGWLLLEADIRQHQDIKKYAIERNFRNIDSDGYALSFRKLN